MTPVLDPGNSADTARLLYQFFGEQATVMAVNTASELRLAGREDVALEWDLVSVKALELSDIDTVTDAN